MLSESRIQNGQRLIEYVACLSGSKLLDAALDETEAVQDSKGLLEAAIKASENISLARSFQDTDLNKVGRIILESILTSPGSDMPSARGTWWGALNGVTHAVDHVLGNNADTRLSSAQPGQRSGLKTEALTLATQYAQAN